MSLLRRRRFLFLLAGGGAAATVAAPWLLPGDRQLVDQNGPRNGLVTRVSRALGSNVTMTAAHSKRAVAARALEEAFAELETVESVMSIYRPDSQLSRLNRDGVCDNPHPYLVKVLLAAEKMSQQTGGAFDVTVQPLWQTFWEAHAADRQPTVAEISSAHRQVGWQRVDVSPRRIRLRQRGTAVTLNGIAQGFAADLATKALRRCGIEHALIDTGEFGSLGKGSDGDGWNVGIQHPRHADSYVAVANLAGRCLATSGDYATKFDESFTNHHLLDPRTGRSASELASVSIVAQTGLAADALSTAAFVLGLDAGRRLVMATPGADALFVTKTGQSWASPDFPLEQRT